MQDRNLSRRKFLGGMIAVPAVAAISAPIAATGSFIYPPDSLLRPPAPKKVTHIDDMKPWEPVFFAYEDVPSLAMKVDKDQVISFTLKCTHLGCTVDVPKGNLKDKQIVCPCHGGVFDNVGTNVAGPPPKPLKRLAVSISSDGTVIVQDKGENTSA
ncbi:ubiquinol-cytochrome c reductase iron-sulfur subunit [Heliobacterium chlorum]|uniref:Ubiquinol-cytochrome c reductase iron-sulfur subunit n=1 Tax=Heliobacterium chlorum TaxID=2698 RepID=A0ABR7SYU6_HELCL|nr:ubiquinol-cytochrome c reductase iron-sulfur subunit [Heliobacterium chlorum]MBC9783709.1 ubiquinol-cytochrome c reductase iron-sulfur subunit [Heliobacterium chlorum]